MHTYTPIYRDLALEEKVFQYILKVKDLKILSPLKINYEVLQFLTYDIFCLYLQGYFVFLLHTKISYNLKVFLFNMLLIYYPEFNAKGIFQG
jgi:hypothetical protein